MVKKNAKEIDGVSIYRDQKNRAIYSNIFMKDGYVINSNDIKSYFLYNSRLVIGIIVSVVLYYFIPSLGYYSLIIGALVYVIMAFLFYKKYLPSLNKIKNFEKPYKDNYFKKLAKTKSYFTIIAFILSCVLFGILLIFNAIKSNYDGFLLIANYIVGIFAILFGLCTISSLFFKIKNKE